MIIEKQSLYNKIKYYFNSDYRNQVDLAQQYVKYIDNHSIFINSLESILIVQDSSIEALYNPNTNTINIPLEPSNLFLVEYQKIASFVKDNTFEFMIFHEIGHAVQHTNCADRSYKVNPIDFGNNLSYLFNGSSNPHLVSILLRKNYQESYSDCYAAFCIFKKNNNNDIFEQINAYREHSKLEFTKSDTNYLNQYSNTKAILEFKKLIIKETNLNYQEVHKLIELAIITTTKDFLLTNLQSNDSLLKEIKEYGLEFNKKDGFKGFWETFHSRSSEFNILSSKDINDILQNPIYKRDIAETTPFLSKLNFGWESDIRYSLIKMNSMRIKFEESNNHCHTYKKQL